LVGVFRLFRGDDVAFLRELRLPLLSSRRGGL
jgi:hypothetical protein